MSRQQWFHGLVAAFVGGAAGAIQNGLVLMFSDPKVYNLSDQFWHLVQTVGFMGLMAGVTVACAYLKKSPLWDSETVKETHSTMTDGAQTVQRDTVESTKTKEKP